MAICSSFHAQMASILEILTKTALAEMTKLVDDASAELRLEMCRSQRENEALKSKLLVMEGELRAARGCGEGTSGSSLNIAFEVKVCDEFSEAQNSEVVREGSVVGVERVFDERLSIVPVKDEQYGGLTLPVEKKKTLPDALDRKYEPVDGEQDWSESVLLNEDWLEEDPKTSTSQLEQKISEGGACGTSGAAAANGGKGPLFKEEEELHMQLCPAGDPEKGLLSELKVQSVWSKATRLGKLQELLRHHGGGSEHGGVRSNDRFSPRHFRASQRLLSEKNEGPTSQLDQQQNGRPCGPPNGISADMAFPLGSWEERVGSTPCEASCDASAEAESCRRIERREEFVCTCCEKTFPDALELSTHEEQHGTGRRFACSDCGKRFRYNSYLKIHQRVHTGEKLHSCNEGGKSFAQLSHLKSHQIVHTGDKLHSCNEGGKSFAQLSHLKYHQSVHTEEKPHSCNKCGKCFAHLRYLKSHQSVHTGEKPHSCNECGKCFAHLRYLKYHQSVHTGEKPHSCNKCGKCFAHLRYFKSHQSVHTGEKPHSCDECGKSFAHLRYLKSHQSVHTGEKSHRCDECGKSFAHLCQLKTHQRVHTGEKPHSCDKCGKSFALLSNLKTHQSVHTGEKPYSCMLCGKSFSQNHNLQKHILTHS